MTLINPSLSLPPTLATGISPTSAHVLSLLFTSSYVGSMYLSHLFARSRPPPGSSSTSIRMKVSKPPEQIIADNADDDTPVPGSRDYPDTIRSRMKAGSIATAASLGAVWWVVKEAGGYGVIAAADISPTLRLLGIPTRLTLASFLTPNTFLPYLLAPTLLLGPLFATYLDRCLPFQRFSPSTNDIGLIEFRNYLVGPLTEELVFRSTILSVSILARLSSKSLIFGTPLWFGLAHAHHAVEVYRRSGGGREAAVKAIGGCGGFSSPSDNGSQLMGGKTVFQFGYTTLFGWFASYLFLRTGTFTLLFMTDPSPSTSATSHSEQNGDADLGMAAIAGSILPPLLSHMFCNFMGIYLPTNAVRRHPRRRTLIWGAYVAGVLGFVVGLRAL